MTDATPLAFTEEIVLFDPTKKKKKKKATHVVDSRHDVKRRENLSDMGERNEEIGLAQQSRYSLGESQHDYKYEELLQRLFGLLHENNPELAGDKKRTVLRSPQILLESSMKTVFVNLVELSTVMHRQPEHVMTFMLTELGTSGSLDGENRLVVSGRFPSKKFEDLLWRYINEYVLCQCCRSPDTLLSRDKQALFLQCEMVNNCVDNVICGFVEGQVTRVSIAVS